MLMFPVCHAAKLGFTPAQFENAQAARSGYTLQVAFAENHVRWFTPQFKRHFLQISAGRLKDEPPTSGLTGASGAGFEVVSRSL